MRKIITSIFIVTTVGFVILYVLESKKATKHQKYIKQLNRELESAAKELSAIKSDTENQKSKISNLKNSKIGLVSQLKQQAKELKSKSELDKKEKSTSNLDELMNSPEMLERYRSQIRDGIVKPVYGNYIKALKLSEMDEEAFRTLLTERYMIGVSLSMKMLNSNKKQRSELKQKIKNKEAEVDSMIKKLLDDEKNAEYEKVKETTAERIACNQFNEQLFMTGCDSLPAKEIEGLVTVMYEERLKVEKLPNYFNFEEASEEDYTEKNIQKIRKQMKTTNEGILEQAKKILNKEQYKSFENFMLKRQSQQEMGIKMMQKRFNQK